MRLGQYYYAPHRRLWGIWQTEYHDSGAMSGNFIKDCPTKEQARSEVYRLNGWKLPKSS